MNKLGMIALVGMLIAVIGFRDLGENAPVLNRGLVAWGLALCIGVLIHWVNALQRQVDQLKSMAENAGAEE